jgi:hypothetical protein
VESGAVAITLHGVQDNAPEGDTPLGPGTRRYAIEITVENVSQETTTYSALFGVVTATDDIAYPAVIATEPAPPFTGGALNPGESIRGWLTFDLPTGRQPAYFIYETIGVYAGFALR